jgi:Domain of unknown function (DUF4145)
MSNKIVTPELGAKSFTCPHCGAISHQTWFRAFAHSYEKKDDGPFMPVGVPVDAPQEIREIVEKLLSKQLFKELFQHGSNSQWEIMNLYPSVCYSCSRWCVWVADKLVYPSQPYEVAPNEEMPPKIKSDFVEAASIVDLSPRGAAALLRLCIQKLMKHLGETGDNINADIKSLVSKGLDGRIQKALDVVRVIGNNAVHAGQIDIRDDKATAVRLFGLVNMIVEAMIAAPKHIEALYSELPPEALAAIDKRDGGS